MDCGCTMLTRYKIIHELFCDYLIQIAATELEKLGIEDYSLAAIAAIY